MKPVFAYTDAQQFLRDWLEERNQSAPKLSYEMLARQLGLRSRGHAHRLFHHHEVPITPQAALRLCDLLGLKDDERAYFETLVAFNRATRMDEKKVLLERMQSLSGQSPDRSMSDEAKAYLSDWYFPALREGLCLPNFKGDFKSLGKRMRPQLSEAQVRNAAQLLLRLGMVQQLPSGRFRQTESHVHAGAGVAEALLAQFQKEMLQRATEALLELPPQQRHITTLTFSLPQNALPRIKQKFTRMQQELIKEILKEKDDGDCVLQFNMQLFPLLENTSV